MKHLNAHYILLVSLTLAACSNLKLGSNAGVREGDWYTEGSSSLRQHRVEASVDPPLAEKWRYDAGAGTGPAGALIIDGRVLVANRKGQITAINLESGKREARARFDGPIEGGMSARGSTLYVPVISKKNNIVAYDIQSGGKKWSFTFQPIESGLLAVDEQVIAVDANADVRALNAEDGALLWEKNLSDSSTVLSSPLGVGERLFVADDDGDVFAMNARSGSDLWHVALHSPVYATMSSDETDLFVPTTRGRLFALSAASGEIRWCYSVADSTVRFSSPAFDSGKNQLVFGSTEGVIRSLNVDTGQILWKTDVDGAVTIAPLVTRNTIYVGSLRGILYALDKNSGRILWEEKLTGRIKSAITASGDRVVVLAETQQVFMFEPAELADEEEE